MAQRMANEWVNRHDPQARITKLKDGRRQLAYKAERAVDLDTGAVAALTVQPADRGDTESRRVTLGEAGSVLTETAGQATELLRALCWCFLRLLDAARRGPRLVVADGLTRQATDPPRCRHLSPHHQDRALSTG